MRFSPQFGATITNALKLKFSKLEHHNGEHFINVSEAVGSTTQPKLFRVLKSVAERSTRAKPPTLQAAPVNYTEALTDSGLKATWLSHSAALLSLDGTHLIFDPMLGEYASPLAGMVNRMKGSLPPNISVMPKLDAALISHDHYDHLDHATIKRMDSRFGHYVVPLGVGEHLKKWGVNPSKITELDWWQSTTVGSLTVTLTPSYHSSGRTLAGQKSTLWGSFVVEGSDQNVYFSGDSGYANHFEQIGKRFGSFDLAMIECGQYNKAWPTHHMFPEQSFQAALDLNAKTVLPIHWSGFVLSTHAWDEPITRLKAAAKAHPSSVEIITPQIGHTFSLTPPKPHEDWWNHLNETNANQQPETGAELGAQA